MRSIIVNLLYLSLFHVGLYSQSDSFKTYMNPVIPGDHADCTITKVGNDFYTTGSSFNPTPVIYHSTDLVHWEAIAQPVSAAWSNYDDRPGGGCWGGHIVYYNGEYWDFFSRANTMYFVKADNPEGPWSLPVRVNNPTSLPYSLGYDNSIFIDDDNKWYLVVKNGQPNNGIVELGDNGQPTGVVYNLNWLNPSPSYPYSWAEGPVMWKYGGYYYYSFARDLGGGQKVMRSQILTADQASWEMLGDFFNENDPNKGTSLFTSPNHASPAIMLDDSTSWVLHPLYAKGEWKGQGRQGLLNQVHYNTNGRPVADYPINQSFTAPKLPSSGIPWMVPKSDFFSSENLHPEWSFLGYTTQSKYSLTERPGWLRLSAKSSTKANTLIKNDGEHNYSLITRLEFDPQSAADKAGLWIMRGDETMSVKLVSSLSADGIRVISFSFENTTYDVENTVGDTLWLKLVRINHKINGYFSDNGINWTEVGQAVDVSQVDSYSDFSTFTGTRQGLYVVGSNKAWFDLYIYRDAFTPILTECPANQYGTTRGTLRAGIRTLDNIHDGDWALYAGVEFGNGEYYSIPDSVTFTASCATSGGAVEVWLDSLGTGNKIATCNISSTGSWSTFQTFTSAVAPISGRHDVYLKFTGTETGKLFQLQWFHFTALSKNSTLVPKQSNSATPQSFSLQQNFPNPFNPTTRISFKVPNKSLISLKVYNLLGEEIAELAGKQFYAGEHSVVFDASYLASGIYFYTLRAKDFTQTRKMFLIR
ncbi:family 43 glycosylhydrolase [candidate division KSB1 bacterium]|nr:family 43 glycosylhydrolase [candidate division KSB1 bacterium]